MMKMLGGVTWCCVALLLALNSVSAVQKTLKSINGLKKINFGQAVPMHSLLLLHWFANEIDIDNNNIIELTFDPNREDYGSHHYGNYEGVLDPLPRGNQHRYYTIGNLNEETSTQLPPYVFDPISEDMGSNMDRIIFRVREQNIHGQAYQVIDQVYITQHIPHQGTVYDPAHTYRITTNLLREIREFSVGEDQPPLSYLRNRFGSSADDFDIENKWGELACLGLLLYIVIQEKHSSKQQNNRPENRRNPRNEREHNVPRNVQNQGYVAVNMGDYEDRVASRRPVNTESDCCNTFTSCIMYCFCFLVCIFVIIIVLGIIISYVNK
ncbi:Anthranilate phosphoribosyltransferase [Dissostichus eleginoides]|uniref:Anthranilate phosphoribosyltransferase n=1 Tax=Dissostichus eleginoides TaxID=100907 RepID=A0AAD9EXI5_DISEL|nr:Anthranilate phosphoribosyltransferase [Dissostichus eleginoides]